MGRMHRLLGDWSGLVSGGRQRPGGDRLVGTQWSGGPWVAARVDRGWLSGRRRGGEDSTVRHKGVWTAGGRQGLRGPGKEGRAGGGQTSQHRNGGNPRFTATAGTAGRHPLLESPRLRGTRMVT